MQGEGVSVLFAEVDGWSFAVDVSQVEALRRRETVWPARGGPPDLLGFVSLGGVRVPMVDLGIRWDMASGTETRSGVLLVAAADVAPLAFRVDRVDGPVHLPWSAVSLLPDLLRELQPRPVAWGMAWRGEEAVPLLDLSQIVPPEEVTVLLDLAGEPASC